MRRRAEWPEWAWLAAYVVYFVFMGALVWNLHTTMPCGFGPCG